MYLFQKRMSTTMIWPQQKLVKINILTICTAILSTKYFYVVSLKSIVNVGQNKDSLLLQKSVKKKTLTKSKILIDSKQFFNTSLKSHLWGAVLTNFVTDRQTKRHTDMNKISMYPEQFAVGDIQWITKAKNL